MENQNEIWKDIKGYEGFYQVSNLGNVKSLERYRSVKQSGIQLLKERILKYSFRGGYKYVVLYKNDNGKKYNIHRLVAESFIPNINNKPCVNHIDEDILNNNILNLEWVTYSENTRHGNCTNKISEAKSIPIIMKDKTTGNILKRYKSAVEAEQDGFSRHCICICCKGRIKSHKGYKWEYEFTN